MSVENAIAHGRSAALALTEVAAWFARQVVGNELGAITPAGEDPDPMGVAKLPGAFRDAVAQAMVDDPRLGWPDSPTSANRARINAACPVCPSTHRIRWPRAVLPSASRDTSTRGILLLPFAFIVSLSIPDRPIEPCSRRL